MRSRLRSRLGVAGVVLATALVLLACGGGDDAGDTSSTGVAPLMARSGGMTTAFDDSARVFSLTARNINHYERQVFAVGKDLFEVEWVADASADFNGLGPHYDQAACADCHVADGRAAGPRGDGILPAGFVVKLTTDDESTLQRLGHQLTSAAVEGVEAEATVSVTYEEVAGEFSDGEPYSLRRPTYAVQVDGPELPGDAVVGVRVAPHLVGLGLLELVPEADVRARVDEGDADGDGVSGRPGAAVDLLSGASVMGRFGWTASQPSVEQQTAGALFNDMGLTSRYFPSSACDVGDCERSGAPVTSYYEPAGFGAELAGGLADDSDVEISDERLYYLTVYSQALAAPAVRDVDDAGVQRGWELFNQIGCAVCHAGPFTTAEGPLEGLSNQVIHPYTDLLVHDLGDGLGDRTVDGDPVPTEWRTPPLWGVGLFPTVNGHSDYLHDGRARNLSEAILWHGGEAAASADAYRGMDADDRVALLAFLEAL